MYKKLIIVLGFLMTMLCWGGPQIHAESVKSLSRSENQTIVDQANMLSDQTKQQINQYNEQLKNTPLGGRIVVLTVNSTDGESIDSYSDDLISQKDWQHFGTQNKVIAIIIFAKNDGENNVRITTSRNARIIMDDSTALDYLQDNYDALKSSKVADNNRGLQNVLGLVDHTFTTATVKQVNDGLQQQAENDKMGETFAKGAIMGIGILAFGFLIYGIKCGIQAIMHLRTLFSEWYKHMLDPMREDSMLNDRTPLNYENTKGLSPYYVDNEGNKHYVRSADRVNRWYPIPRTAQQRADYQIAQLFAYLASSAVVISINAKHYFEIKSGFSDYGRSAGLIDEVIRLKKITQFKEESNGLTSFTYQNAKYYVSKDMMKFFDKPNVRSLYELDAIHTLTRTDIHDYYGVIEDMVDANRLPLDIYVKMFPNEKTYQLWKDGNLPSKNDFTLRNDRYVYDSDSSVYLYPSMMYSMYPTSDPNYSSSSSSSSGGGDMGGGGGASI